MAKTFVDLCYKYRPGFTDRAELKPGLVLSPITAFKYSFYEHALKKI